MPTKELKLSSLNIRPTKENNTHPKKVWDKDMGTEEPTDHGASTSGIIQQLTQFGSAIMR